MPDSACGRQMTTLTSGPALLRHPREMVTTPGETIVTGHKSMRYLFIGV